MAEDRGQLQACWLSGVVFRGLVESVAAEQEAGRLTPFVLDTVAGVAETLARVSSISCGATEAAELIPLFREHKFEEAAKRLKEIAGKE